MEERNYLKEFIWLWIKAIFFYVISGYLFGAMASGGFDKNGAPVLPVILFGLTFFNKVIRFNLFGNHDIVLIFWVLKIGLSLIIGVIAFPIVNIFYVFY